MQNDGLISRLASLCGRDISENLQLPNTPSYSPVWLTHFAGQQSSASLPLTQLLIFPKTEASTFSLIFCFFHQEGFDFLLLPLAPPPSSPSKKSIEILFSFNILF